VVPSRRDTGKRCNAEFKVSGVRGGGVCTVTLAVCCGTPRRLQQRQRSGPTRPHARSATAGTSSTWSTWRWRPVRGGQRSVVSPRWAWERQRVWTDDGRQDRQRLGRQDLVSGQRASPSERHDDLLWYRHEARHSVGSEAGSAARSARLGRRIWCPAARCPHAVNANNDLLWHHHDGYGNGKPVDMTPRSHGRHRLGLRTSAQGDAERQVCSKACDRLG
jgi:hypothetical protein